MKRRLLGLVLASCFVTGSFAEPIVIAHRGASGYLPEHTLEAATLAYAQGADYIEQDLVLSKDLVPVVLHDIHLDTVTDVATQYPQRHRDDGRYYVYDFTLAELKTLNVHERTELDGKQVFAHRYQGKASFKIATFAEQLELIGQLNRQFKRQVGYYPEIKSPAWHQQQGADISLIVLTMLRDYGLDDANKAIYVQCFDYAEIKRLRTELGAKVKLVQLIGDNSWGEADTDYTALQSPKMLAQVAKYAQGIGPWLPQVFDLTAGKPTALVNDAHQAGLQVHPYTFRQDALPAGVSSEQILTVLFNQVQVDGLFTDFSDTVVNFLQQQTAKNPD